MEEYIPPNKIENARAAFPIPQEVYIIAFIDTTIWGSGKTGLAITDNGVYWRNGQFKSFSKTYISWEEFCVQTMYKEGWNKVAIGYDKFFYVSSSVFKPDIVVQLLDEIQSALLGDVELDDDIEAALLELEGAFNTTKNTSSEWMIAVAGQQYGPYEFRVIREMVQIKQIQPENTHVWKAGMPEWVEFSKQPEMAALVAPSVSPPPMPKASLSVVPPASPIVAHPQETLNTTVDVSVDVPVDFNQATEEQLQELSGIGIVGAKRILQERDTIGGFQSAEQVGELLELKPHQVDKLKKQAMFGKPTTNRGVGRKVDY